MSELVAEEKESASIAQIAMEFRIPTNTVRAIMAVKGIPFSRRNRRHVVSGNHLEKLRNLLVSAAKGPSEENDAKRT